MNRFVVGGACVGALLWVPAELAGQLPRHPDTIRVRQQREVPLEPKWVCAGRPVRPFGPTQDSLQELARTIDADFVVRMPPRFGNDANGNGIPDVPNTLAYVTNGGTGRFDVVLEPHVSPAGLVAQWTVTTAAGAAVYAGTLPASDPLTLTLAEGQYAATLRITARYRCWEVTAVRSRAFTVRDFLIVVIGDSYASGEGNPERTTGTFDAVKKMSGGTFTASYDQSPWDPAWRVTRTIQWADDGKPDPPRFHFRYHRLRGATVGADAAPIDLDPMLLDKSFDELWTLDLGTRTTASGRHIRAHRSTVAWPAQLAQRIEDGDAASSVTFVFLAATGASIARGALGPHVGSTQQVGWLQGVTNPLPAQLEEVKAMVGSRTVDLLIVSLGGNDVGFSGLAAALILKGGFSDITFNHIRTAMRTGDWPALQSHEVGLDLNFLADVAWKTTAGFQGLMPAFEQLRQALAAPGFPAVSNVLIAQYPDATRESDGTTCEEALTEFGRQFQTFRLDRTELAFARNEFLAPLNDSIAKVAADNGWILLDDLSAFNTHGLCAGSPYPWLSPGYSGNPWPAHPGGVEGRWFRTASESRTLQGLAELTKTLGTLHPNEFGHAAIARRAHAILTARGVTPE